MWKAVCLASICLLGTTAVLALKPSSNRALSEAAAASPANVGAASVDDAQNSLVVNSSSKADRLPSFSDQPARKLPVETIKVTPVQVDTPAPAKSAPKAAEVTTWHWHVGSKITKQTVRQQ